jgi:hypothetical protein
VSRSVVVAAMFWLGRSDRLLIGDLASPLRCLTLSTGLLHMGSRLLPLPNGVPSLWRYPDVRPRGDVLQQNSCHGLRGQSVLQPWCGGDGSRRCPHAMHLGDGEARALHLASGCVELIGGVLEDGTQHWPPAAGHSHEDDA